MPERSSGRQAPVPGPTWCPTCAAATRAQIVRGAWGPHHMKAVCGQCGRFRQWLSKEGMAMLNKVTLLGTVGDKGVEVRALEGSGALQASFLLKLSEPGKDGRVFSAYHAIECYGQALAVAETLEPGDVVLVEGKLRRKKMSAERWDTAVVGLGIQKLHLPALVT